MEVVDHKNFHMQFSGVTWIPGQRTAWHQQMKCLPATNKNGPVQNNFFSGANGLLFGSATNSTFLSGYTHYVRIE